MAVFSLAVATTLIVALGLPSNLFGSAPREQIRSAASGEVSVVDGETLRLGQHTLRLIGLDAPGRGETCLAPDGRRFDCGAAAAEALSRLLASGKTGTPDPGATRRWLDVALGTDTSALFSVIGFVC